MPVRRRLEAEARTIAAGQRGIVTRGQLLAIGYGAEAINWLVESQRLRTLHRGVYLLGPALESGGRELAAVLACGPDTYASHHSAASLLHLPLPSLPQAVHVTIVGRNPGARPGLIVHRTAALEPDERQILDGIPLTTPARTALDLAPSLELADLEHLLAEAQGRNASTFDQVHTLITRYPRRPATGILRALLEPGDPARTRARSERRFLALVRRAELPRPETNAYVAGYQVNVLWRPQKLVVEIDSQAWHAARPARERDSRRDQELVLRGYIVLRVTWRQITEEPEALVARVAAALARRGDSSD